MKSYCVITFYSTHYALKAEKVLKDSGLEVELIPVPRELSSNCGISMKLAWPDKDRALATLKDNRVETEKVHKWEN